MRERSVPEALVTQFILALMEAAGLDEIRVPEEALVRDDPDEHLITYRDAMRDMRVYRRRTAKPFIDGEEVPPAARAIEAAEVPR